jgi:hypothetical protein
MRGRHEPSEMAAPNPPPSRGGPSPASFPGPSGPGMASGLPSEEGRSQTAGICAGEPDATRYPISVERDFCPSLADLTE